MAKVIAKPSVAKAVRKRKSTERFNFTKRTLEACTVPEKGRRFVFDTKIPTLAVQVTSTGTRTFYRVGRVNGRPVRVRIGGYPALSIEQARNSASILNMEIAQGKDPAARRRAIRAEYTFKALFYDYIAIHARPHKRTWAEDERQFKKLLTPLHNRRLSDIQQADIATLHARIGKRNGHYAANRALALLVTMFNFATSRGWNGRNPTIGVKRFKETSRDRFLSSDELQRFLTALADEPDPMMRDFFLTLLFTGARRGNVQAMRWDDLNLERGLWRIPEEVSKNKEQLLVALARHAVKILQRRAENANGSPWVFATHSRTGHVIEPKKSWGALLKRAEIEDFHIHDLRRTLGSWLANAGTSLQVIGKALGHRSLAATQVYARLDTAPVRTAVETTTSKMLSVGGTDIETLIGGATNGNEAKD